MIESRHLPPYPPASNAWQFPPPPISRTWWWVAIASTVAGAALGIGLLTAAAVMGGKDFPGLITDDRLISVISGECELMTSTVESMPVTGRPRQQAQIISDQNRAVENMLTAIRRVDEDIRRADRPTNDWLKDWDRLIDARERLAAQVATGARPELVLPRDASGHDISWRMGDVWLDRAVCEVPTALLDPYPQTRATSVGFPARTRAASPTSPSTGWTVARSESS